MLPLQEPHAVGESEMSTWAGRVRLSFFLLLGASFALVLPAELRAQTCTLESSSQAAPVDAASSTRFVPSGGPAQIYVQRSHANSLTVRVFEAEAKADGGWKMLSERRVLSIKPAPERPDQRFLPSTSSVIRFIVPDTTNTFWEARTFVVRICDQASQPSQPTSAVAIVSISVSPPIWSKIIALGVLLLFYVGFAFTVSRVRRQSHPLATKYPAYATVGAVGFFQHLNPVVLTANAFNRGSIQKLQVLLFSFLIGGMVLSLVLSLGYLTDLSLTVALLLGISAVGAAVAQTTATNRNRLGFENWAWLVKKEILPINEADQAGPRLSDLVMTNRELDIYKLQTLIFTVVVAIALLVEGEENLGSFTVPQTLLGILGLSQVVYVSGTFATPASVADLDGAITALRELETKVQTVIARNADTDADGKLPAPLPPPPKSLPDLKVRIANAPNATTLYAKKADQVEIMIESALGAEVDRGKLDPALV